MKSRYLIPILFLILCLVFSGCEGKDIADIDLLSTHDKNIIRIISSYSEPDKEVETENYYYNEDGKISHITYREGDNIITLEKFSYNENSLLKSKQMIYWTDQDQNDSGYITHYIYNSLNPSLLEKEVTINNKKQNQKADTISVINYIYENNKIKIKSYYAPETNEWYNIEFEYNELGQIIKKKLPYDRSYIMYKYNKKNLLEEKISYLGSSGTFSSTKYTYNSGKQLIKTTINDVLAEERMYDGERLIAVTVYEPGSQGSIWLINKYEYSK